MSTKTKPKTEPKKTEAPKGDRAGLAYEAFAEKVRGKIAEQASAHEPGSVNDPHVIAGQALDFFDAYRHHPWFRLLIEAAAK